MDRAVATVQAKERSLHIEDHFARHWIGAAWPSARIFQHVAAPVEPGDHLGYGKRALLFFHDDAPLGVEKYVVAVPVLA